MGIKSIVWTVSGLMGTALLVFLIADMFFKRPPIQESSPIQVMVTEPVEVTESESRSPLPQNLDPLPNETRAFIADSFVDTASMLAVSSPVPESNTESPASEGADALALTEEEQANIYRRAQVFRDEALEVFPLLSMSIHTPEFMADKNSGGIGPRSGEIWIRIKPENSGEMKEIMAQTADLYRQYVKEYDRPVRIVLWVGGQIWAVSTYGTDGILLTP